MALLKGLLAAAAACSIASAQDWGTTGAWETVVARGGPPPVAFRKPTHVAGTFVVAGNNTASGNIAVYQFDLVANVWTNWPDITGVNIQDPFLFEIGGTVIVIDELNQNALATIDSGNPTAWRYPTITGGPVLNRFGQRFVAWGSTLYMWGGVEYTTGLAHNDMWALDLTSVLTGGTSPTAWFQVAPDNTPGFPPARVGYSFIPFGVGIVMFGGVNVLPSAPAGTLPDVCFSPSSANLCEFHHNIWGFFPGNPAQAAQKPVTGTAWIRFSEAGAYGGPVPSGRFDHSAGNMGDQLFVFGGTTAAGTSDEMWAYNLVSQTWQQVTKTSPWPSAATSDIGYGAGTVIGRHLYQYVQGVDQNGMPLPNAGQLWRWAPSASAGSTTPIPPNEPHPGAVAGIVIGILLGIGNLVLLVMLANNAGVITLPSFELGGFSFGGGSSRKAGPAGFYGPVSSSAAAAGDYMAPA